MEKRYKNSPRRKKLFITVNQTHPSHSIAHSLVGVFCLCVSACMCRHMHILLHPDTFAGMVRPWALYPWNCGLHFSNKASRTVVNPENLQFIQYSVFLKFHQVSLISFSLVQDPSALRCCAWLFLMLSEHFLCVPRPWCVLRSAAHCLLFYCILGYPCSVEMALDFQY